MFRKRGFSLLDVILALVILSAVIGGLLAVLESYTRATARGRSLLVATHLVERVMETQLALGYDVVSLPRDPGRTFQMLQYSMDGEQQIEYWYSVEITDHSDSASTLNIGLKKIEVVVGWAESKSEHTVDASALVYWNG